jgi:AbrB family looped-hinge helix DNA binding protein
MNTRLTIDKAGRVVILKPLREELHLEPGDSLEMESAGEQIILRPVRWDRSACQRAWRLVISQRTAPARFCHR